MSKKKATSSDVAKRAGVSQATVSMVLNKKYNVSFSRETVEKVEQAARELGYHLPGRKNRKESRKEKLIVVFALRLQARIMYCFCRGLKQWRTSRDMVSLSVIHREIPVWRRSICV